MDFLRCESSHCSILGYDVVSPKWDKLFTGHAPSILGQYMNTVLLGELRT
jgi:hypothetical protein